MTLRDLPAIVIALAALALGACELPAGSPSDPTAPVLVCNPGPQGATVCTNANQPDLFGPYAKRPRY